MSEAAAPISVTSGGTTIKAVFNNGDFLKPDGDELKGSDASELIDLFGTDLTNGITEAERDARELAFGKNELAEHHTPWWKKFFGYMWNPLSWVMEFAAVMAIAFSNGPTEAGQSPPYPPPDWEDFVGIIALLIINATLAYVEESQAGDAVAALKGAMAPETVALRDGKWLTVDAVSLVPGDLLQLKLGDVIPADAIMLEGENVSVDQAALTGESLPVSKKVGADLFSGATLKQGELVAVVVATGVNTFFGKAAHLVATTENKGHFQQVLRQIGTFCIGLIAFFLVAVAIGQWVFLGYPYRRGINNLIVLLIGGIPIAMPTVLSVTLAIGAHQLAEKKAIVSKMSAIEELAGMDMLCSDKTGTLTLNKLTIDKEKFVTTADLSVAECIRVAAYASRTENSDAIDTVVLKSLERREEAREGIELLHFTPFDPTTKRTEALYKHVASGKTYKSSKGMAATLLNVTNASDEMREKVEAAVDDFASHGLRALGVARAEVVDGSADNWEFIAVMPIFDPPRHDTAETIARAMALGVSVKMLTGDQLEIAKETARRLQMGPNIYPAKVLNDYSEGKTGITKSDFIEEADGFSGVFPEHKFEIVAECKRNGHIVAMTGDGVNDAPALKCADVGIAVADATDAARAAASIVLTEPGLSVVIDAILTSRMIFQRMKSYALYACATTVRIVLTFSVLVWAFKFDFPPFIILVMAVLNDGTIMTISRDVVVPNTRPDKWALKALFIRAIMLGAVQSVSTIVFFSLMLQTRFFHDMAPSLDASATWTVNSADSTDQASSSGANSWQLHSIIYLQSSILGQASIFCARTNKFSFQSRPGLMLMGAYIVAQLVATLIAVYADWPFTHIAPAGWDWAGVCWIWSMVWFPAMDIVDRITDFVLSDGFQRTAWFSGHSGLDHSISHMNINNSKLFIEDSKKMDTMTSQQSRINVRLAAVNHVTSKKNVAQTAAPSVSRVLQGDLISKTAV
eukprot:UC1_evm1s1682